MSNYSALISFVLGLSIGILILSIFQNVLEVVLEQDRLKRLARMTDEQKQAREERRRKFESMSKRKKIGLALVIIGPFTGLVLLVLYFATTFIPSPEPRVVIGHYPPTPPEPVSVGFYVGVAILVAVFHAITGVNLKQEGDGPQTIREAVWVSVSIRNLVGVLSLPLAIYASVLIGNWQVPIYEYMEGLNLAEFSGVVKATSTVLGTWFILHSFDFGLPGVARRKADEKGKEDRGLQTA